MGYTTIVEEKSIFVRTAEKGNMAIIKMIKMRKQKNPLAETRMI